MKIYFSRITADHWQAKNKLEDAAKDLSREMDRRLINETEIEAYKKEFKEKIELLNQKYSRCRPLSFSIQEARKYKEGDDVWIYCDGVFNMSLFLVKDRPLLFINVGIPANPSVFGNASPDDNIMAVDGDIMAMPAIPAEPVYISPENRRFLLNPNADGSYTAIITAVPNVELNKVDVLKTCSACSLSGSGQCRNCNIPRLANQHR